MEQLNCFKMAFLRIFIFVVMAILGASLPITASTSLTKVPEKENWNLISAQNDECIFGVPFNYLYTDRECWTVINGGVMFMPEVESPEAIAMNISPYGATEDHYAITPQISLPTNALIHISFNVQNTLALPASFEVYISETGTEIADFTQLGTTTIVPEEGNIPVTLDIPQSYSGKNVYVAIKHIVPEIMPMSVITITDFSLSASYPVQVNVHPFGTVEPENLVYIPEGEELTLKITPDADHHLMAVFANNDMIRGEDISQAGYLEYTVGPYNESTTIDVYFTNNSGEWIVVNGNEKNKWHYGQVEGFEDEKFYISDNNGVTNRYDISTTSIVHLYRDVNVQEPGIRITFDYRSNGEMNDYLQFAWTGITDYPVAGTALSGVTSEKLYGSNEWKQFNADIPAGMYRIVMTWVNDGANGAQYPAAMDNFEMTTLCPVPANLNVEVNTDNGIEDVSAVVSWTAGEDQTAWQVEYKTVNGETWFSVNVNDDPRTTLTNLVTNQAYDLRIKAICGMDDESHYLTSAFEVPCIYSDIDEENRFAGENSRISFNVPFYGDGGRSYVQQIYDAGILESESGNITELSFLSRRNSNSDETPFQNIKIWMGLTEKTSFTDNNDFITEGLTLVYENDAPFQTTEDTWYKFELDRPFLYDGTSNLVVVFYEGAPEVTGEDGNGSGFASFDQGTYSNKTIIAYSENADLDYNNPQSAAGKMRRDDLAYMDFRISLSVCIDDTLCKAPVVRLVDVAARTAEFSWNAEEGENVWQVEYRETDGQNWTSVLVTDNNAVITGLTPETDYQLRASKICADNLQSDYSDMINFTTITGCEMPQDITYSNYTDRTTVSWTDEGHDQWVVAIRKEGNNAWTEVPVANQPNITFNLDANSNYNVRVKAVCGPEDESGWVNLNVTTGCAPYSLPFAEPLNTENQPQCWTNVDNKWTFARAGASSISPVNGNYLITPAISIPEEGNFSISFGASGQGGFVENLGLMISTTGTGTDRFVPFYSTNISETYYESYIAYIPEEYNGQVVYIAFVHQLPTSGNKITIQNVVISGCTSVPSALTVEEVGMDYATVSWTSDSTINNWILEYSSDQQNWVSIPVDEDNYRIEGLNDQTTYYIRVKSICSANTESIFSDVITINTLCGTFTELPFTENFEGLTSSNFPRECWSLYRSNTVTANWTVITAQNHTPGGSVSAYHQDVRGDQNAWLISPRIRITGEEIELKFWSYNMYPSSYGKNSVWISTGSKDPASEDFVEVWAAESVASEWVETIIDLDEYKDQEIYIAFNYQGDFAHRWYLDDIFVGYTESCTPVLSLNVNTMSEDSARVVWTTNGNDGQWEVQYRSEDNTWSESDTVDVKYFTLRNLIHDVLYSIRVRAVCANSEGMVPEWVTVNFKIKSPAETPYFTGFESEKDNMDWHISNINRNDWYFGNATNNGGNNSLYISYDQGSNNSYNLLNNGCRVWAYRDVYFKPSTKDYILSFDWRGEGESTYDYMKVFIGDTSVDIMADESTSRLETPDRSVALINPFKGTDIFNLQSNWVHFSTTLDAQTFSDTTVRIYFGWGNDGSYGAQPPAAVDNFSIRGDVSVDLAMLAIDPYTVACQTSSPVTVGITQLGDEDIMNFTVNYQHEDNTIVTEQVVLAEPLEISEVYYYTFPTEVILNEGENTIRVWVEHDEESPIFLYDNTQEYTVTLLTYAEIPYEENFTSSITATAWTVNDANDDGITWQQEDGRMVYTYSDINQANDWLISRCIHIPAGTYEIGYTYNALSALPESFTVVLSSDRDFPGTPQVIAQHLNFSRENTDVQFKETFTVAQDGIYYIGIHAISNAGNAGITFDNFYINSILQLQVNHGSNGTVQPAGNIDVNRGESVTLLITPDPGYHLQSISVNGEMVRGEDLTYAEYIPFIYGPVTENAVIDIAFTGNTYTIRSFISNYDNIGMNGNPAIGGAIAPQGANTFDYGTTPTYTIAVSEHFHLYDVFVDNVSVMDQVVMVDENIYTYTFGNLEDHHTIRAVVKIDTIMVTYNVTGGIATLNGELVDATGNSVVKEFFVDYGYNHTMTLVPVPGYYIQDVVTEGISLGPVRQFVFRNVTEPKEVDIYLNTEGFTITTAAHGHGTITEGTAIVYNPDYEFGFEVIPAEGYHISHLTINGISQTVSDASYYNDTIRDITEDYNIQAYFAINTYTVEAVAGENGRITPSGSVTYNWNTSPAYTASANTGYFISEIIVDNDTTRYQAGDNVTTWTHVFTAINSDHIVNIQFGQYVYSITATVGANGTITPEGVTQVSYNGSQRYSIQPEEGYVIAGVTIDGEERGAMASYTFTNVTSDHTISATFAKSRYEITATAGTGGSVTPSGTQTFEYGDSQVYTATPDAGYMISTVTIDGTVNNVYASTWSHTFADINADHTIYVNFTMNTYTITVTQPANGYITPGSQTVNQNATPTYYITPSNGYEVENVIVDGNNVTFNVDPMGNADYTFPAVTANKTITATMKLKTYTITATSGANGTISPAGANTVNYGASQVFTITPADGYEIADVKVDNVSVGPVSTYRFPYVTASHTIHVEFELINCETPVRLYATDITSNSAVLHWSTEADNFTIRYKTREATDYTEISNVTGNQYALTGLSSNTFYVWRIQANCGYNDSEWSDQAVFTTRAVSTGIEENTLTNVKVYSNMDNVYIINENDLPIKTVEIYDIFGRTVYQNTKSHQSKEMIHLPVASGTYVVRLLTADGVGTYKVNILK